MESERCQTTQRDEKYHKIELPTISWRVFILSKKLETKNIPEEILHRNGSIYFFQCPQECRRGGGNQSYFVHHNASTQALWEKAQVFRHSFGLIDFRGQKRSKSPLNLFLYTSLYLPIFEIVSLPSLRILGYDVLKFIFFYVFVVSAMVAEYANLQTMAPRRVERSKYNILNLLTNLYQIPSLLTTLLPGISIRWLVLHQIWSCFDG